MSYWKIEKNSLAILIVFSYLVVYFCHEKKEIFLILSVASSIKFGPCSSGRVAQSVTCLATDACLTADPGVASSIPVRSHTAWRLIMK